MQFPQWLISGVAQGCIYGLIALSLALVYKTAHTKRVTQGALMVLGPLGAVVAVAGFGGAADPGAPAQDLAHGVVMGATLALCVLLVALFRYSKLGLALQAAWQNPLAATYAGIPVRRLNGMAWCLAVGLAAIAGLLLAPLALVNANLGWISLKALPAAVVGSLRGLPGTVGGGVLIGLLESLWSVA